MPAFQTSRTLSPKTSFLADCDGAGLNSTADHSTPAPGGLQSLAQTFMDWFRSRDMIQPTLQHLASHPLSKDQQLELAKVCHSHLLPSLSADAALHISPGQPFRLRILQAMAEHIKDPDSALPAILEQGVPTGIFEELPTSHQWQQRPPDLVDDSLDDIQLTHCTGNWTQAEKDPALLQALVQKEIEAGHVKALQGGREAARYLCLLSFVSMLSFHIRLHLLPFLPQAQQPASCVACSVFGTRPPLPVFFMLLCFIYDAFLLWWREGPTAEHVLLCG